MFSHAVALTVASIIAFAAANIGDLIVLMLFFGDQRFQSWQVVLGQYLGVSAVIGLCLLGAGPASHQPHMLIRVLGIVPIAVGLHKGAIPDQQQPRQCGHRRIVAGRGILWNHVRNNNSPASRVPPNVGEQGICESTTL